jgi:hypothetical protein
LGSRAETCPPKMANPSEKNAAVHAYILARIVLSENHWIISCQLELIVGYESPNATKPAT